MKTEIEERAERKKLLDKYDKATDKEKVEIQFRTQNGQSWKLVWLYAMGRN
jgi:hypothetical protein